MPEDANPSHGTESESIGRPEPEVEGNIDPDINKQCLDVIERFKTGQLEKLDTFFELQCIIPSDVISGTYKNAFKSYMQMCEGFERYWKDARSHTEVTLGGSLHEIRPEEIHEISGHSVGSKHQIDADTDEEDPNTPRKRVDVTLLLWVVSEEKDPVNLSESLKLTRTMLENYSRDLPYARNSLLNSFRCPQFPFSEWKNVLSGEAVNLDHVLSGLFTIDQQGEAKESLGSFEISVPRPKITKKVYMQSDWENAWRATAKAIAFAFPHRENKLEQYGDYIHGLFSTAPHEYCTTSGSSVTIKPSGAGSHKGEICSSPTYHRSPIFTCIGSKHLPDLPHLSPINGGDLAVEEGGEQLVVDGMKNVVPMQPSRANIHIAIHGVDPTPMLQPNVKGGMPSERLTKPRYLRRFIWNDKEAVLSPLILYILPLLLPLFLLLRLMNYSISRHGELLWTILIFLR
jgi:hypothetical protein